MRLQVKKLEGPDEIIISGSQRNSSSIPFTVYFNRSIENTDTFPIIITVKVYNATGTLRNTFSLRLTNNNLVGHNRCSFHINNLQNLAGTHIYVHTVLSNTDTNAQNVSYSVSSYHETIKKVYLAAAKRINHFYWSGNEQITDMDAEENVITQANANEDAFIHIKAQGMYNDTVEVVVSVQATMGKKTELRRKTVNLSQNRKVIAISMADVIARYRHLNANAEEQFNIVVNVSLAGTNHNTINFLGIQIGTQPSLTVLPQLAAAPRQKTSTGTVYVNVNPTSIMFPDKAVNPTKFTDFQIGCVAHLEGVGRSVALNANNQAGTYYTVYPFRVYELMLSDLVACGLVTIDEVVYLTTANHNGTTLIGRADLVNTFDKTRSRLSSNKTLLNVFQDTTNTIVANRVRINKIVARQVLAQVCTKTNIWNQDNELCRDAWQLISGSYRDNNLKEVFPRAQNGRYDTNKECPPGEYFLNYLTGGNYRIFVSQDPTNSVIYTYPDRGQGDQDRGAIAIHRGGSKASVGCITFNLGYDGGNNGLFNSLIFPSSNNNSRINLLCIDERNAIKSQADTHTVYRDPGKRIHNNQLPDTQNFWRWYDLTTPIQ